MTSRHKPKPDEQKDEEDGDASSDWASEKNFPTGSGAPNPPLRSLEQNIGKQIRRFRKQHGLTVTQLSEAAGVSIGMLSKIENGQISPSLTSLSNVARALNLPMTELFADLEEQCDCSWVKADQGVVIQRRGSKVGHQYQLLGHSLGGDVVVEPYLITLSADATPYVSFAHAGTEFIYMLTGEVVYAYADREFHLKPGDSLMFDARAHHGPKQLLVVPMTYLSIITYPRSEANPAAS
ncbi:MAG: XRE family transcriptional regulator [Candidatus Symbiobacter sp.]|nr:XRE family transcriptional regulator [Candidatus Symbiobacter sp.]